MKNNIEIKINELLRKEKGHLKSHLLYFEQNLPWISLAEEEKKLLKDFSVYGWIGNQKEIQMDEEKLKEEIKKKILGFAQGLVSGLRLQLRPKICQKDNYDSSNLIIKNKLDFERLNYNDLIDLFKEVDLSKGKKWVCFLPIELFKITEGKKEHFELKKNLLDIVPLPLENSLQIIFAEISSPLITYSVDLFCQENWNNMGKNILFLVAKSLYRIEEVKGRLMAISKAKPVEFEPPLLGKCQTCKKPLSKDKAMGAKRVEFSDEWYYFCSRECSNDYDYRKAMERGESSEDYLKRKAEEKILTQQAIKEFAKSNENFCRRCSKPIELVKSCGEVNCPYYIPGGNYGGLIKKDLKISLPNEYFIANLCNSCSDKFEDVLAAFYNYWTIGRTQEEFGNENIETNAEGGYEGRYFFNTKDKIIRILEGDGIQEFDLRKENLESIINSMNF